MTRRSESSVCVKVYIKPLVGLFVEFNHAQAIAGIVDD
jgi:hypothetical protein